MSFKVLFTWIGHTDLRASRQEIQEGLGPIGQAVTQFTFTHVVLISNYKKEEEKRFVNWLKSKTSAKIVLYHVVLSSPTDFQEIYESVTSALNDIKKKLGTEKMLLTYHLSPGTPAMAAVWILLSKTSHPAGLIESSPEQGVKNVSLPFEISADYVPDIIKPAGDDILNLTQGLPPESPEFGAIIHRCRKMKRVIAQARRLAVYDVPVLIEGESGTGKELFARAIHAASTRKNNPFIAVNCGSIPPELVESEFFGHKKGSFTGAIADRKGFFSTADGGTLFLDEIGELPLSAQVKLLRAIQENKITRIGDSKPISIDIRIIAATNRNLIEEVKSGKFREDLFHRIAVGILRLPPLRDRHGDIDPVINHILDSINKQLGNRPGWKHKNLSAGARNLIHQHAWPGNIRELYNTLTRAAIMVAGETIGTGDLRDAMISSSSYSKDRSQILNCSLGNGFSLPEILKTVARHYLERAMKEAKGNKTEAARLLGLPSYQTLSNWLHKYDVNYTGT